MRSERPSRGRIRGGRASFGLVLIAALALCGMTAQTAAASKGTTAFTCKETISGGAGFSKAHCRKADAVASGATFEHVSSPQGSRTETTLSNVKSTSGTAESLATVLKSFNGTTQITLWATGAQGEGWSENSVEEGASGEHYFHGSTRLTYSGITVLEPSGFGCKVYSDDSGEKGTEGALATKQLLMTTKGQGDAVKFEPEWGTLYATFFIEGCTGAMKSLNGTYEVTGTVTTGTIGVKSEGATLNFSHADTTSAATLFLNGPGASHKKLATEGALTISGLAHEATSNPLSVTTPTGKGTTAFTCKEKAAEGGEGFSGRHCKKADTVGSGAKYEHESIAAGARTLATATNAGSGTETKESPVLALRTTIAGITTVLQATGAKGEGWLENSLDASGEHYAHGIASLTLTGVTMVKPEAGSCKVVPDHGGSKGTAGVLESEPLLGTTTEQGDFVKFQAAQGKALATFYIEGCAGELKALNGTYEVSGSAKGTPDGATLNFSDEATTETLLLNGSAKVGFEGTVTISASKQDPAFTPLSPTTVETP